MLIPILIGLLIFATAITYWGQINEGEIMFAPIMGIALAALYSTREFEDEGIKEYTLQCCIVFLSVTVVWEKPMSGLN